jgi:putative MATE family efflux protein
MIFGIFGLVAFNLADTFFVGKLGTSQMAALTFTFPVVLILNSLNMGLGIGASVIISKAFGEKDHEAVKELSTDSLLLGFTFAIIASTIGLLTIEPVFNMLGADPIVMPFIKEYMSIWYFGVPFVVIPMIGNSIIRALGDTKTPSMVMLVAAISNIILDPILIFGFGSFPGMGVKGAAIATVIARSLTFSIALYVLIYREKVVSIKVIHVKSLFNSWKTILFIGLPNAIARMILPIGLGIITSLISKYGYNVVAGYGIATRVEYFALAVTAALSSVIPVFVGQNLGANKMSRIKESMTYSQKFSVLFNISMFIFLYITAPFIARLFSQQDQVIEVVVMYLRIVPIGYGMQGIVLIVNGALNALRHPILAASLNLSQMLIIYVPLALVLSSIFGLPAIFASLVISYVVVGIISMIVFKKILNAKSI